MVGRTESDYNATLWPPTDQLKLGLAQLSLSVGVECGHRNVVPPIRDNNYLTSIPPYLNPKLEIDNYQNLDSISERFM